MKNFGKILISLFAAALLICMLAIAASAANIGTGSYNDSGFAWSLDDVDGNIILTITDTEETKSLTTFTWKTSAGEAPNWNKKYTYMVGEDDYLTKITEVIYKADASTIGGYAFGGMTALKKLTIHAGVTSFLNNAIYGSKKLTTIAVDGEDLGENTINFTHVTKVGGYFFESSLNASVDYKVYLSNDFAFNKSFNKFPNLGAGDTFYVDENYPYMDNIDAAAEKYGFTIAFYPKAAKAMEMYGYQIRTEGYHGLRGIFNFDKNAKNEGFSLVEYGAILVTDDRRGENDVNIKLALNEATGEYEAPGEKVVKKTIMKNGALYDGAKLLRNLDGKPVENIKGDNYQWFAVTLVNYKSNYKKDIYMCGYEIWKNNSTGAVDIVYTPYANAEYESENIYDISLQMLADGYMNTMENNPVGEVIKAAGTVVLTENEAVLPTGKTELLAEGINMMSYSESAFTESGASYSLYEMSDGNYLAYIGGAGEISTEALKSTYASGYEGEERPVPTLLEATAEKITRIVIGEGIKKVDGFRYMKNLVSVIYPTTLVSFSTNTAFNGCNAIQKAVPVGMITDEKIIDLGGVAIGRYNNIQYTFQYCALVEYIRLSAYNGGVESFYGCKALKAVWIGDEARPADGTADLRETTATSFDMCCFTGATNMLTLLLPDTVETLGENNKWGFSIKTIYQPTANETIKAFCDGDNKKAQIITYTQSLPVTVE